MAVFCHLNLTRESPLLYGQVGSFYMGAKHFNHTPGMPPTQRHSRAAVPQATAAVSMMALQPAITAAAAIFEPQSPTKAVPGVAAPVAPPQLHYCFCQQPITSNTAPSGSVVRSPSSLIAVRVRWELVPVWQDMHFALFH